MGAVITKTEGDPSVATGLEPLPNQPINKTMERKDLFLDEARPLIDYSFALSRQSGRRGKRAKVNFGLSCPDPRSTKNPWVR